MRLAAFPAPVEGESLRSVAARFLQRMAGQNRRKLNLLGLQSTRYNAVCPVDLSSLTKAVPSGHPWSDDPRHVLVQHTLVPLYLYFASPKRALEVVEKLSTGVSRNSAATLGLTARAFATSKTSGKFCPDCLQEDLEKRGFYVGYRNHDPAFVGLCVRHNTVLHHECRNCFTEGKSAAMWRMAGTCGCGTPDQGVLGNIANDSGQGAEAFWIAQQVQLALAGDPFPTRNRLLVLRQALIDGGFGYRGGVRSEVVVEALEARFGKAAATLGGWYHDRARVGSPEWPGRMLGSERGVPDVYKALLMTALVADDVNQLSDMDEPPGSAHRPLPRGYGNRGSAVDLRPDRVRYTLEMCEQKLTVAAGALGISSYTLAAYMRRRGMGHNLAEGVKERLGKHKLTKVRRALRKGIAKKQIQLDCEISEWTLLLIELDALDLRAAHREATVEVQRERHRSAFILFMRAHPNATRTQLAKAFPGSFDWLRTFDAIWMRKHLPARRTAGSSVRRSMVNWEERDRSYAFGIYSMAEDELTSSKRPVRITKTLLLRGVGATSAINSRQDKLPLTTVAVEECAEAIDIFHRRRLAWALGEHKRLDMPVSANLLRRIAALHPHILFTNRMFIIDRAKSLRIPIDSRSFLSPSRG